MTDIRLRQLERAWQQDSTDESAINYMTGLARSGVGAGNDDSQVDYAAWLRFLQGHWTLEPPTQEGMYQRATKNFPKDGKNEHVSPPILIYRENPISELRAMRGTTHGTPQAIWHGYWWSEPTPALPSIRQGR